MMINFSLNQERELIEDTGTQAMAVVFGGSGTESLTSLCHGTVTKKIVSLTSVVTPARLPPTARHHAVAAWCVSYHACLVVDTASLETCDNQYKQETFTEE